MFEIHPNLSGFIVPDVAGLKQQINSAFHRGAADATLRVALDHERLNRNSGIHWKTDGSFLAGT